MKRILIVDDEQDIRELLKKGIDRHKYEGWVAESGEEALELCTETSFDLALIDIAMPQMDGYETCRRLREDPRTRALPVIFLTGKELDPRGIERRFQELNASAYLQKPATLNDVLAAIRKIIGP